MFSFQQPTHTVVSVCHITATREVRVCPVIPRKEKENLLLFNTCGLFFYNRGVKLIAGRPESAKQRLRLQIQLLQFPLQLSTTSMCLR